LSNARLRCGGLRNTRLRVGRLCRSRLRSYRLRNDLLLGGLNWRRLLLFLLAGSCGNAERKDERQTQ
jgi:hypothetical protein